MTPNPSATVIQVWSRLLRAQRVALASVEQALKRARLPPLAWYDALLELEHADAGLRPFELEQRMLLAQYNLSRLLDRLEEAGLIERRTCIDDRRGQIISITAAGRDTRRQMWSTYRPAIQRAVGAHLSPQQAENLAALLGKLSAPP
jgi:DNA-binding MarR family transcriptional regulator